MPQYTYGKASCKFEVIAQNDTASPENGYNSKLLLLIALLFASGGMFITAAVKNKKHIHKNYTERKRRKQYEKTNFMSFDLCGNDSWAYAHVCLRFG